MTRQYLGYRKSFPKKVRRKRRSKRSYSFLAKVTSDPCFPLFFFIRNLITLDGEASWRELSPRVKRIQTMRMLEARARIFLEVRNWRRGKITEPGLPVNDSGGEKSDYCINCGGCCEIASGFRNFPEDCDIPMKWQRLYGDGLGKGHRFCAFLWEVGGMELSQCAIHPWRALTCRIFEKEECDFFFDDLKTNNPYDEKSFSMTLRRLTNLIDGR